MTRARSGRNGDEAGGEDTASTSRPAPSVDETLPAGQLGSYIKVQRQLADLSLRQLAAMTQVSNAYLSQIERGLHQPSLRVVRSIAEALDVSAESLLEQAGVLDAAAPDAADRGRTDVETAIRNDPDLTADERAALITVYRSYRSRRRSAESRA